MPWVVIVRRHGTATYRSQVYATKDEAERQRRIVKSRLPGRGASVKIAKVG